MRTLLAGDVEGICAGVGGGVTDSAGEIENAGNSSGVGDAVGVGDSWPKTAEAKNAIRLAILTFAVMSSGAGASLS